VQHINYLTTVSTPGGTPEDSLPSLAPPTILGLSVPRALKAIHPWLGWSRLARVPSWSAKCSCFKTHSQQHSFCKPSTAISDTSARETQTRNNKG
jgi:hypothetical protein